MNRRSIDWQQVRDRLKESETALERAMSPGEEQIATAYRERAAELAERRALERAADTIPVLVFSVGSERYGIEVGDLAEVVPFGHCTPVPEGPRELLGLINLRGEIRSVIDLARMLEIPEAGEATAGYVLILRQTIEGRSPIGNQRLTISDVGLRVDKVEQIEEVSAEALAALAEGTANLPSRYVRGLTPDRVILLSAEAILSDEVLKAEA